MCLIKAICIIQDCKFTAGESNLDLQMYSTEDSLFKKKHVEECKI